MYTPERLRWGGTCKPHGNWLVTIGRSPLLQHVYNQAIIRH